MVIRLSTKFDFLKQNRFNKKIKTYLVGLILKDPGFYLAWFCLIWTEWNWTDSIYWFVYLYIIQLIC